MHQLVCCQACTCVRQSGAIRWFSAEAVSEWFHAKGSQSCLPAKSKDPSAPCRDTADAAAAGRIHLHIWKRQLLVMQSAGMLNIRYPGDVLRLH